MKKPIVIDSHALLRFFQKESGFHKVEHLLKDATVHQTPLLFCLVNLAEFCYIIERKKGRDLVNSSLALLEQLPIKYYGVTKELTLTAGRLKAEFPISLADAFCAATAIENNGTIITGDPEFHAIEHLIAIEWI